MGLSASQIAPLLRELGQRTALRGGNPYRAKAYTRAADNLFALSVPIAKLIAEGRLQEIPGVGEAISDIIARIYATGTDPTLEKLRKEVPEGVLEMLDVPGLRPDKVLKIHGALGLASLADLEEAVRAGRLRGVKGLGAALEDKIQRGIDLRGMAQGRWHLHRARGLLDAAQAHLRGSRLDISRITPAGAFRRGCELVGDLSLVVEIPKR